MKISLNWLKDYLKINAPANEIMNRVSLTGIEVADVITPSAGLKKIVVGHINDVKPHPDSDHLNVCMVNVGEDEDYQIVCGAPNVAAGQDVIVAMPNSHIAGNEKIKKGKLRGVESMGMICGLQEIGFSDNVVPLEYKDGIYVFEEPVTPGEEVYSALGMDDEILDFDITPNRADTLGMNGAAFEMGAIYEQPISIPVPEVVETDNTNNMVVNVSADTKTRQYRVRTIENVEIGHSPMWIQRRLWNAGIRPINNVVDITNYVLLEYGQPIHAFDLDKLSGNEITVRKAKDEEKIMGVDEKEYELINTDVVIADDNGPIAIAGVMGGKNTEVDANTKNIVIESAVFDETMVRKAAQHLNIHSESSSRFEKGIDNSMTAQALDRVAELISKYAAGEVTEGQTVGIETEVKDTFVEITTSRINRALGLEISTDDVIKIFDRLQFKTTVNGENITVAVPARRWDISIDSDLIEEVIRLYGYDNLQGTLPTGRQTLGARSDKENFIKKATRQMRANGFNEAITYSMVDEQDVDSFQMVDSKPTKVAWPMTEDHEYLRTNIVEGLLDTVKYNSARKQDNLAFYEAGRVFLHEDGSRPVEREYLAAVLTGDIIENDWHHEQREADFFDIKSAVENVLDCLNRDVKYEFVATDEFSFMHPGQTAKIIANNQFIGFVGKVHPVYEKIKDNQDAFVFQIDLDTLYELNSKEDIYEPIPKYPTINRDIAILVKDSISNQEIANVITANGGKYLVSIKLFDIYQGKNIEEGFKSMAYNLTFQNKKETLTDDQINQDFDKIVKNLQETIDAQIR
ncbi:phenylalanine--tRNA ligase beta subunit [Companilactobacillus sp. RD055328]|uniref:phenylalanine--tRNA ligase subunit beta n=1 Tax=Companilactobacillus sp. RD055328 TaxID=2916634 RepID=UPI001FC8C1DC|nr:phenylalanine--tRNA ligase subunit beta [Companilactobacillus sp. RD055328]GKQ42529.1 phenylalanine--tRNA ligase beta subunit [Companilactobacillus sp. RD055328]